MTAERQFADGDVIPGTRYRVLSLVGVGGMGAVYEVEHTELGKRFMVKALHRHLAPRADLTQRLRNEWRALARLEHANIVTVTDAGASEAGVLFYVMERLEGETLSRHLRKRGALPLAEAVAITEGLLSALSAAHAIGIVHRDIKPSNVFLPAAGGVKLLDFGIAKIQDAQSGAITGRGYAMGTPRYMSPEQVRGDPVDGRADLYAVGLVLFEMLAGRSAFAGHEGTDQVLLAQLTEEPPRLDSLSPDVPAELDELVARLLDKDPRRRPDTARAVLRELVRIGSARSRGFAASAGLREVSPTQAPATEPLLSGPGGTAVLRPPRPSPSSAPPTSGAQAVPARPEVSGSWAGLGTVPAATPSRAATPGPAVTPVEADGVSPRLPLEVPATPFTAETRPDTLHGPDGESRSTTAVSGPPSFAGEDLARADAANDEAPASLSPDRVATRTALPSPRRRDSAGGLTPPPIEQASRRPAPRRGIGILLTVGGIVAAIGLCAALVAAYRRSGPKDDAAAREAAPTTRIAASGTGETGARGASSGAAAPRAASSSLATVQVAATSSTRAAGAGTEASRPVPEKMEPEVASSSARSLEGGQAAPERDDGSAVAPAKGPQRSRAAAEATSRAKLPSSGL